MIIGNIKVWNGLFLKGRIISSCNKVLEDPCFDIEDRYKGRYLDNKEEIERCEIYI